MGIAMRPAEALVRFVYGRCGAAYARPRDGRAAAERGPRKVKSSEAEALQRAVQERIGGGCVGTGWEGFLLGEKHNRNQW